jgi:hypothetical protein
VGLVPGIDIRGDGGFIVVPPSLHASGRRYAWDLSAHPDDVPLAPAPAWLLALLQFRGRQAGQGLPNALVADIVRAARHLPVALP